ncbi:hypothetical protein Tco_0243320, partial [Tanacetum coccineum]
FISELRRSGRVKCKGTVIEENTVDDAYSVEDDSSGDDFVKTTYVKGKGIELDDNGKKGTKRDSGDDNEKDKKVKWEKGESSSSGTAKRLKTKKKKPYVFQTRTTPKALYNVIVTLKPIQKAWLARIRFADVLEFKCDGIPSKMGFYVVDNFSQHKMEIKLNVRSIEITQESIGEMLGIINEGVDIMEEEDANNEEMVHNWVDQFKEGKDITPSAVKFLIRKSKVANMNFKLNFIVLFTSMMYVDGTVCNELNVGRKSPPTSFWPFVEEEGDPMPEDEDKLNKYVENIRKERNGFERTFAAADVVFRGNTLIADVYQHYREALNYKDEISEGKSCSKLSGDNNEELHEKEVFTMVDKVVDEFHSSKKQNDFEAPSFSLGVTQDFEMVLNSRGHRVDPKFPDINVAESKEEKKVETYLLKKIGLDQSEVLFETETGTMASTQQMESLVNGENIDDGVVDAWCEFLNSLESLRSDNSMSRFFLPIFTVDKKLFGIEVKANESVTKFLLNVEKVNERGGRKSIMNLM